MIRLATITIGELRHATWTTAKISKQYSTEIQNSSVIPNTCEIVLKFSNRTPMSGSIAAALAARQAESLALTMYQGANNVRQVTKFK